MTNRLRKVAEKWIVKRLAKRHLLGKPRDRTKPESVLITEDDIASLVSSTYKLAKPLIHAVELEKIKSRGNRLTITLGLYHVALYRSLRKLDIEDDYAIDLASELGWSVYKYNVRLIYKFVRLFVYNKQKQLNTITRLLMLFPFSQDANGYQRTAWNEADHLRTDWTQCAVLVAMNKVGNEKDLNFFRNSWCQYDFRVPEVISKEGYYGRKHTLSSGDNVCDMKWYAKGKMKSVSK